MNHRASLVALLLLSAAPAAATEPIAACGTVVPPHKSAVLTVDLNCAAGPGVVLSEGAKLILDGHTLSGSPDASNVVCNATRGCKITGPGAIVGGYYAVTAPGAAALKIRDVTVRDQLRGGLDGMLAVHLRRVAMTNVGFGPDSPPGATEIIRTGKLDAVELDAHDNDGSVSALKYHVVRSRIVDNGGVGIGGGRGKLLKSTVTGNQGGPVLGPIDVLGDVAPTLVDTVCDHSHDADDGGTLGICRFD